MANTGHTRLTIVGRNDLKGVPAIIRIGAKVLDDIIEELRKLIDSKADQSSLSGKANTSTVNSKCDLSVIAPSFSTKSTYAEGKFVIQNGKLYECTTAVEEAGSFKASNWTERTVAYLVEQLNAAVASAE